MAGPPVLAEDLNRRGIEFVLIEIALAKTFLDLRDTSAMLQHQQNAQRDAEQAYHSALHFLRRLTCTSEESDRIETELAGVKTRLEAAGSKT
jgi:hypothetical protein